MLNSKTLCNQSILSVDHVVVIVFRKLGSQSVRRLGSLPGADRVRENYEIFACVERLPIAKQLTCKSWGQHPSARTTGPVQHKHRLTRRGADGCVMDAEFGQ